MDSLVQRPAAVHGDCECHPGRRVGVKLNRLRPVSAWIEIRGMLKML